MALILGSSPTCKVYPLHSVWATLVGRRFHINKVPFTLERFRVDNPSTSPSTTIVEQAEA
jgi:hypothetical protein